MSEPTPYTAPPAGPKTNTLAIVAIILGFVVPVGGIITGHIALGQIKRTGEAGHGLALTGTIVGYVLTALYIVIILFSILVPLLLLGSVGNIPTYNY
jgi:Domain of unknown function (DUF4190)